VTTQFGNAATISIGEKLAGPARENCGSLIEGFRE
jgi:hypothetical protein